jgi:hypothetical protein
MLYNVFVRDLLVFVISWRVYPFLMFNVCYKARAYPKVKHLSDAPFLCQLELSVFCDILKDYVGAKNDMGHGWQG